MPIGQETRNFEDLEDPNIVILELLKNNWGSGNVKFKYRKEQIQWFSQESFFDGGKTPCIGVHWTGDDVGRIGIPSTGRYHHSKHTVWVFAHKPDERWQCVKEVMRILQRFQNHPSPNIERVDYYDWVPWQQESPNQTLFRATTEVVAIYVF